MNYTSISSKVIIAKLDNDFNVSASNWIASCPTWIADALDDMQLISTFEDHQQDLEVIDYHAKLESFITNDIKRIDAIIYDGYLLNNTTTNKSKRLHGSGALQYHSTESFTIRNGYIVTSFETGTITILYKKPKIEYDEEYMIYYPYIPDNSILINAITYYIIFCILRKGHKVGGMSLDSNNPITNPYLMWIQERGKAKNSVNTLDPEERREMSRQYRSFIVNLQTNQNITL